jgi:S1-C subfamily serine protease
VCKVRNRTTITVGSGVIPITYAIASLLIVTIIASLIPLQASAQNDVTGNSQGANSNSSAVFEQQSNRDLTFRDLFAKVNSSVVQITSSRMGGDGNNSEHRTAIGSGFVIDKEGHVATNYHVIANSRNVSVAFSDGSIYAAKVIGSDAFSDSAVLELQDVPQERLIPLPLGNSSSLAVGDEVIAIGSPFGLAGSMSTGVVSGLGRLIPSLPPPPDNHTNNNETITTEGQAYSIPNIIQTDAAINPGNSGGPLLNLKGEVVGINSAGISASPFGGSSGVGFAIPSDTLKVILPALIADGYYVHPWIGFAGTDVTPEIAIRLGLKEAKGFLVIDVVMGSPANKAGIRGGDMPIAIGDIPGFRDQGPGNLLRLGGDIILQVDNQKVSKINDILSYIEGNKKAGDTVTLTVLRDGEMMPIDLVLGARPPS